MAALTRTHKFYGHSRYMSIFVILVLVVLFVAASVGIYFIASSSGDTDSDEPHPIEQALEDAAQQAQSNPAPAPAPASTQSDSSPSPDSTPNTDADPQPQDNGANQSQVEKTPLVCSAGTKNVNGVCVPEIRYLSGFDYADCDQKYVWSTDLKAYVNEKKDRALIVKGNEVSCYPVSNGKIDTGNYGTRVLDIEVLLSEHDPTDIPEGLERTMSGFRYANCDGHYRWSVAHKAFINDEHTRALIMDGVKLRCHPFSNDKIAEGAYGSRVIGVDGVKWI